MNKQQEEFLKLAVIELKKYREISSIMKVELKQLSAWWDELSVEREMLASQRKLWKSKCKSMGFWEFKSWYERAERKCHYCGITEPEIKALRDKNKIRTKRWTTRGRTLEIDRMAPEESYDNLENLVFCCYWCNNAKTDEFTPEEFRKVGEVIAGIWESRRVRPERFASDGSEMRLVDL